MTVAVYKHTALNAYPDISKLIADFGSYKDGLLEPSYFGRDGDYRYPQSCLDEEVWHIHLEDPSSKWNLKRLNPFSSTSNKHLVYCTGFTYPDRYYLITVLEPDAHEQARNIDIMNKIGEIAAEFRETN